MPKSDLLFYKKILVTVIYCFYIRTIRISLYPHTKVLREDHSGQCTLKSYKILKTIQNYSKENRRKMLEEDMNFYEKSIHLFPNN